MSAIPPTVVSRAPADMHALEEAAAWYARWCSDSFSEEERQTWTRWHAASPSHRAAWSRIESMRHSLARIPGALAAPALTAGVNAEAGARRTLLRGVVVLFGTGALGWLGWNQPVRKEWMADLRTGTGEQRDVTLTDGSRLALNTQTSIDVSFDEVQRLLVLRAGEVMVQTARDPQAATQPARPFLVDTAHGRIRALGTRFLVRSDEDVTRVTVLEKAVEVSPSGFAAPGRKPILLQAGEQLVFDRNGAEGGIQPAHTAADAWLQGNLIADNMPLAQFLAEIGRYRSGIIGCDPAIGHLLISGTFPIRDTDRALQVLVNGFPLRVEFHTRYWTRVLPL